MSRLNSDYIKRRSSDPTGGIALLALLAFAASVILVPVGALVIAIHGPSPHRAAQTQPPAKLDQNKPQ